MSLVKVTAQGICVLVNMLVSIDYSYDKWPPQASKSSLLAKVHPDQSVKVHRPYGGGFSGTILPKANLSGAALRKTVLIGAGLRNADLSGANLSGANLAGSNLSGTNLNQDYMISAILYNTTMPYGSLIYTSC